MERLKPHLLGAVLFAAFVAAGATAIWMTDRVFLPRHSTSRDLPWATTSHHEEFERASDNRGLNDKVTLIAPDLAFTRGELRAGRWPRWNPHLLGGVPHAANPLSATFYPPTWIATVVDLDDAFLIIAALHLFLAGIWMAVWLRGLGCRPAAVWFGALTWALCGWASAHLQTTPVHASAVWLPLALWGVERRFRTGDRWSLAVFAGAWAMSWLGGFFQTAVLVGVASGLYAGARLLCGVPKRVQTSSARAARDGEPGGQRISDGQASEVSSSGEDEAVTPPRGRALLGLAGAAILAMLLASVQLGPTLELLPHTERGRVAPEHLAAEAWRPGAWVGLVAPTILGDPMEPGPWRENLAARLVLGEGPKRLPPQVTNWSERTVYLGAFVLALALLGGLSSPSRRSIPILVVAVAGGVLSTSTDVIQLAARIPGLDVGAPARAIVLTCFALCALASFGLERILGRFDSAVGIEGVLRTSSWNRFGAWPAMIALGAMGFGTLIVAVWGFFDPRQAALQLAQLLKDWGAEDRFGAGTERPASAYVEILRPLSLALRMDLLRVALGSIAFAFVVALCLRRRRRRLVIALAFAVPLTDLGSFFVATNPGVPRARLFESTSDIEALAEGSRGGRFVRVAEDRARAADDRHALFAPNLPTRFGIDDAQGYRELAPRYWMDLWRGLPGIQSSAGMSGIAVEDADSTILDVCSVRSLVSARPLVPSNPGIAPSPRSGSATAWWLYRNPDALPLAWVVPRGRTVSRDDAAAILRSGQIDPREVVLLHGPLMNEGLTEGRRVGAVERIHSDPGRMQLRVELSGPAYLVLSQAWFPGWRAWIIDAAGGRTEELPIHPAFGALQAIPMSETGTLDLELCYAPDSHRLGLMLTVFGAVATGIMLAGPRRRGDPRRSIAKNR